MSEIFSGNCAAVYVLLERDGQFFALRRANTEFMDGFYCPPAGKVNEGEDCLTACVREVKEEAGLTIRREDLEFAHVAHRLADTSSKMPYWVDFFFKCKTFSEEPFNAEGQKASECRWLKYDDAIGDGIKNLDMYFSHVFSRIEKGETFSTFGWNGEQRVMAFKEAV